MTQKVTLSPWAGDMGVENGWELRPGGRLLPHLEGESLPFHMVLIHPDTSEKGSELKEAFKQPHTLSFTP